MIAKKGPDGGSLPFFYFLIIFKGDNLFLFLLALTESYHSCFSLHWVFLNSTQLIGYLFMSCFRCWTSKVCKCIRWVKLKQSLLLSSASSGVLHQFPWIKILTFPTVMRWNKRLKLFCLLELYWVDYWSTQSHSKAWYQGSFAHGWVRWLFPDYVDISSEDLCGNYSVMNMRFMWLAAT